MPSLMRKHRLVIQVYDYQHMFDSLSVPKAIGDLFSNGMKNSDLNFLLNSNKDVKAQINVEEEKTGVIEIKEAFLQGDTWASLAATNQMDSILREWEEQDDNVKFLYMGKVSVNILGMVDDLSAIARDGIDSIKVNSYINAKTAEKNLQFGFAKC